MLISAGTHYPTRVKICQITIWTFAVRSASWTQPIFQTFNMEGMITISEHITLPFETDSTVCCQES